MTENHYVLSNCGVRMPRIVYGTAWKKARTAALVEQAIGHGFRGIDTACQPRHYDEAGVGGGLAACLKSGLDRADIYLQTKFTALSGQDPRRIPYDPKASLPEQVAQSFLASLQNLRTPYVDCLVLHSPLADEDQSCTSWLRSNRRWCRTAFTPTPDMTGRSVRTAASMECSTRASGRSPPIRICWRAKS
jgi:diketogulonate reductase-like aldo/keto reductase